MSLPGENGENIAHKDADVHYGNQVFPTSRPHCAIAVRIGSTGRTVGDVYTDGTNWTRCARINVTEGLLIVEINLSMVKAGLAWHYVAYSKDVDLAAVEKAAKEARRGLWADNAPVAPWEWRKAEKVKENAE